MTKPSEIKEDPEDAIDCVVCNHGESEDWVTEVQRYNAVLEDVPVILLAPNDGMLASESLDAGVAGYVPRSLTSNLKFVGKSERWRRRLVNKEQWYTVGVVGC